MRNLSRTKFAILIFCSLLVFLKLGRSEIQGWDEGLYAMRALSIVEFGAFYDQTQYSAGGLYSSSYPPFVIWMMAASIAILGKSAFAVRLFSAICSVIVIFITFDISQRILSKKNALYPSVLLSASLIWNAQSRLGQLDVPVIALAIITFFLAIKIFESEKKNKILLYSGLLFVSFTLCLMSKVITTFLPLILLLPLFIVNNKNIDRLYVSSAVILSFIVASVWFISMWQEYNGDFIKYISAPQLYTNWNNAVRPTGYLFYINQLLVSNPFAIFAFFLIIFAIFRYNHLNKIVKFTSSRDILLAFLLWFILTLSVFSIATTKYIHYTVYILLPTMIMAVWFIDNFDMLIKSSRVKVFLSSSLLISFVWGLSEGLRNSVKTILTGNELTLIPAIFIISSLLLLITPMIIPEKFNTKIYRILFPKIIATITVLLITKIAFINITQPNGYQQGALTPVALLNDFGNPSYIYFYHKINPTDSLNAQLSWYTDGWNLGWQEGKRHIPVAIPEKKSPYKALKRLDDYPELLIIYYFPEYNERVKFISEEIRKQRRLLCQTKCYIVFGMKRDKKMEKMLAKNKNDFRTKIQT